MASPNSTCRQVTERTRSSFLSSNSISLKLSHCLHNRPRQFCRSGYILYCNRLYSLPPPHHFKEESFVSLPNTLQRRKGSLHTEKLTLDRLIFCCSWESADAASGRPRGGKGNRVLTGLHRDTSPAWEPPNEVTIYKHSEEVTRVTGGTSNSNR